MLRKKVSIPAVRVRYIIDAVAGTGRDMVSIPAVRVRYITKLWQQYDSGNGFNSRSAGKIH